MNIVAIGGGDRKPAITAALDGLPVEHNLVTIIPTACSWTGSFNSKVSKVNQFFTDLRLATEVLHELGEAPSRDKVADLLGRSSLIYTIGGNTPYMLQRFAETGIGEELANVLRTTPIIHAGVSAGALLPFGLMHCNPATKPSSQEWDFKTYPGLSLIKGIATAHADSHDPTKYGMLPYSRLDHLVNHFPDSQKFGIGIDNGAAIIFGDSPRIVRADPNAQVHMLERSDGGSIAITPVDDAEQLRRFIA